MGKITYEYGGRMEMLFSFQFDNTYQNTELEMRNVKRR